MQAARWLIAHSLSRLEEMQFDAEKRLAHPGTPLPATGEPFQTSGCPDCNRPFYNEKPGGPLYNYPRPLTISERSRAVREMEIEDPC
jgi:biotin synthase